MSLRVKAYHLLMLGMFLVRKNPHTVDFCSLEILTGVLPVLDALFTVPFSRDNSFVGREDIIAEISKKRKQAGLQNHSRLGLVGLGGVG
jgi:hypothetical protein